MENVFEKLNAFVPVGHDANAKDFLTFIMLLKPVPYYSKSVTLRVTLEGIEILEYRVTVTLQKFFKWSEITQIVTKHYNPEKVEHSPRFKKINQQLSTAF